MTAGKGQRDRAIEGTDRSFAVEASAGTGKTTTIVGRILHLVLEKGPQGWPVPISSICAITFTEKAAGEMKIRLRQELEKSARSNDDIGERARTALRELETAAVSTFHAFAVSLLKERPIEAGLDPRFTVLDDLQSSLFFREVWEPWLNRALVERHEPLEKALRKGMSLEQIQDLAGTLRKHAYSVRKLKLKPPLTEEEIARYLKELLDESEQYPGLATDPSDLLVPVLERTISWLKDPGTGFPPGPGKGGKGGNWTGGRDTIQCVKEFITRANKFAELRAQIPGQRMFHALVRWLIDEFLPEWESRKRANGYLDFDDQLEVARQLLASSRAARHEFHKRFATLLVDEFQDTDPIQLEIVLLLSCTNLDETNPARLRPDPGRLFIVGDPKQSIYRFRGADVETYLETVEDTRRQALGLERLELTKNYRSVPSILGFVDVAFGEAMKQEGHYQCSYCSFEGAGARTMEDLPPSVYLLGDRDEDGGLAGFGKEYFGREAARIARLILQICGNNGWQVEDSSGEEPLRRAKFGDIAILLPVLTKVDALEDKLREAGIPYVLEGGKFYYARSEVASAITLLRAIANPNDAVALYGGLRSIFFGLSDEDLLRARVGGLPLDYRAEVPESSPLHRPYEILRELHRRRHERPASETFEVLLGQTGAREVLAVRGFQSLANLGKLARQLRLLQKETTFSEVVSLLGAIDEEELAESESRLMEEQSNSVRVMTIHKAKGLDFRIVIVACLGSERKPRSESFLADPHGLGIFALKTGSKEDGWRTPGWEELVEEDKKREDAELVRLLYVALTRARDHLVIGIHTKGKADKNGGRVKASFGKTRLEPLAQFLTGRLTSDNSLARFLDSKAFDATEQVSPASVDSREKDWGAILRCEYQELHRLVAETPHARKVLAPAHAGDGAAFEDKGTETARSRAVRLGVALHEAMESADFCDPACIPRLAAHAGVRHRLDAQAIHMLEEMMRNCLNSSLIERARAAVHSGGRVLRELPFVRPLPDSVTGAIGEGKIDLLFEEDMEWVLVDYKTDQISGDRGETEALLRARYEAQIKQYAAAVEALGLTIKAAYLLLSRTGQSILMSL
jgi:ATP-dependent helicase/nuclease subunit A